VENGLAAWELLEHQRFDLLITDYRMPRLSGAELILRVRRVDAALPIIVAAGDLEFFTDARGRSLRISALLQKPFAAGDLSSAVERATSYGGVLDEALVAWSVDYQPSTKINQRRALPLSMTDQMGQD